MFFVLSVLLFSLLVVKNRTQIFVFRALGLIFSVAIVFSYHLNWIANLPITIPKLGFFFFVISLGIMFKRKLGIADISKIINEFNKKQVAISIVMLVVPFLLGVIYFQWDLNAPRYSTPDSGTHYLYMSQTARTGFIPLFSASEIYPASGGLEVFRLHHESYLPGSVVSFFVIDKLLGFGGKPISFQFFNIFWYAIISAYFLLIFKERGFLKSLLVVVAAYMMIALGTFFDFVATSYSAQLFGLFLLIYFLDTFQEFVKNKEAIWLPMFAVASLGMTYVYWLPVAVVFVLNSLIGNLWNKFKFKDDFCTKNIYKIFFMTMGAFVLSFGYLLVLLRINMLSHAVDDGGFSFQNQILSDSMLVGSVALVYFVFISIGNWKRNENNFLANISFAIFSYALALFVLYEKGVVSHYSAVKVMYLLVPLVWVVFFSFLDKVVVNYFSFDKLSLLLRKKSALGWLFLTFLFYFVFYVYADNSKWVSIDFLPLMQKNFDLISDQKKDAIISDDQLVLLDMIKNDFAWTLQENRLIIIAPPATALWAFSYSHVWPRTLNLLTGDIEQGNGAFSPMSIYSPNIIDYRYWLSANGEHVLVFFDTGDSNKWAKKVGFNFADYKVLAKEGNNMLLQYAK